MVIHVSTLIFRSCAVACNFSGRNANVFYAAHAIGKHMVPITQNPDDIPIDQRYHRYAHYLNKGEGHKRNLMQQLFPAPKEMGP